MEGYHLELTGHLLDFEGLVDPAWFSLTLKSTHLDPSHFTNIAMRLLWRTTQKATVKIHSICCSALGHRASRVSAEGS